VDVGLLAANTGSSIRVTLTIPMVVVGEPICERGLAGNRHLCVGGSPFDISEEMSRRRMENEGVVLTAANTVMAELAQDWSRPEGGQLLGMLFDEALPRIG
jgi:hypothetical protein